MIRSFALAIAGRDPSPRRSRPGPLPPMPDSSGWGVHVLAAARDPAGTLWVGTYGQGIYRLPNGAAAWERIRSDTTPGALSWDFVHAFGFGPRGQIWYGTVGNGWGLSTDGGQTWKSWTYDQLGPEWQYVAAGRDRDPRRYDRGGDRRRTPDHHRRRRALDRGRGLRRAARARARRTRPCRSSPTSTCAGSTWTDGAGSCPRSTVSSGCAIPPEGWVAEPVKGSAFRRADSVTVGGRVYRGSHCGLRPAGVRVPCLRGKAPKAEAPATPLTLWLQRPIAPTDNDYIDQTYRYGSTMGGNFQQHQGVEFNNPDGTPVLAIGRRHRGVRRPRRGRGADRQHPARHDRQPRRRDATGSSPSTTTTARWT